MLCCDEIFSPQGLLSEQLGNFRYRCQQQTMASAVESSIINSEQLVIEAGTGVGKTFAYLIPALLSGQKIIISTGTKHLQDQIYFKDLPTVKCIIKRPVSVALLKGRANYLCVHRLEHHSENLQTINQNYSEKIQIIKEWSKITKIGEVVEVSEISEDDEIWPSVTSTVENCLGSDCPRYQDCHVVKARQKAQKSDIVIINHHLFFADLALKEEGFGEILPSANAFIFDEAHQLPELASSFLSTTISSRQIKELSNDIVTAQIEEAPEAMEIRKTVDLLQNAVAGFQLELKAIKGRIPWYELVYKAEIEDKYDHLCKTVYSLTKQLNILSERGRVLARCAERCNRINQNISNFSDRQDESINWLEIFEHSFKFHSTPLDVADSFQAFMRRYQCSWIFTSATLTVNEKFDHFLQQLGLHDAQAIMLDSPYNYEFNTRLFLPLINTEPNRDNYTVAVLDSVLPILETNKGRAFLLFTSYRALHIAVEYLKDHEDFKLLVQGDTPRRELLVKFSKLENAILLGTSSFWEGVDIQGEALSCVVIDKLPFSAPGDPVLNGRLKALRERGVNPFMTYQLPQAVIALKQGVGRLIRDEDDYGVVAICDPRLLEKPYGKFFINSLPKMPQTSSVDEVISFLQSKESNSEVAGT